MRGVATRAQIEALVAAHRVRFVKKPDARFMSVLAFVLRAVGNRDFMDHYWTTIGRTIYTPSYVGDPYDHLSILEHELVHVDQYARWSVLFLISYLALPLPIGLAWFRWKWEREAYLVQIRNSPDPAAEITRIVDSLWSGYGWPWPRKWMRAWFEREAGNLAGCDSGSRPR